MSFSFTRRQLLDGLAKIAGFSAAKAAGITDIAELGLNTLPATKRTEAIKFALGKWLNNQNLLSGPKGAKIIIAGLQHTAATAEQGMLMECCARPNGGLKAALESLTKLKPNPQEVHTALFDNLAYEHTSPDSATGTIRMIRARLEEEVKAQPAFEFVLEKFPDPSKDLLSPYKNILPTGGDEEMTKWCKDQSARFASGFKHELKEARRKTKELYEKSVENTPREINSILPQLRARIVQYGELPELEMHLDMGNASQHAFDNAKNSLAGLMRAKISDKTTGQLLVIRNPRPMNSEMSRQETIDFISKMPMTIGAFKEEIMAELAKIPGLLSPLEYATETYGRPKTQQPNATEREQLRRDAESAYASAFRF